MLLELRFAIRQLIRHKSITLAAILTLAIGIGATTSIYSVLYPVVIAPLPYPEPDRLVRVFETVPDGRPNPVSGGAFLDWQEQSSSFEAFAVYEPVRQNLSGAGGPPVLVHGLAVSPEFLRAFGIQPALGRDFTADEGQVGGENRVVTLSHELWQKRFGGREQVVGGELVLDQETYRVIGVLPPAALVETQADYLIPTVSDRHAEHWGRSGHWRSVIGRLAPGVTIEAAETELQGIRTRMAEHYPAFKEEWSAAVKPLQEIVAGETRTTLYLLFGTVLMVLLISCANISNLLLARGQARTQEMAIRGALGAGRWRISRQMLIESLLLSGLGALAGVLVASFGIDLLAVTVVAELPQAIKPELDLRVLGFAIGLALISGVLFGLLPTLKAGRASVQGFLKEAGRGSTSGTRQRSLRLLVAAEMAFTLMLLVGAGLFLRSFVSVLAAEPGFEPQETLAFDLVFPDTAYPETGDRMAFIDDLRSKIGALPGVETVGAGSFLPLSRTGRTEFLSRNDREPSTDYVVGCNFISGDYVGATGMELRAGRSLGRADMAPGAERVLLIDQIVANDLFPDEDAIGRTVRFLREDWRVAGVVSPVRHWQLDDVPRPFVYVPQPYSTATTSFIVRSSLEPATLSRMVHETVGSLDSKQAIANIRTLEQAVETSLFGQRMTLILLALFAAVGTLLASIGIYGVMSYAVSERDRELAIRSVFGARRLDVAALVIKDGLKPTLLGIGAGVVAALFAARLIESLLYQVDGRDPLVLLLAVSILSAVALVAIVFPARRAATADPARAVRAE